MDRGNEGVGNEKTSEDYPSDSIVKIGQNTKESPVDLRKVAVTQTPVNGFQLTRNNNNNNNNNKVKLVTEVQKRAQLHSLDCSVLLLILTL